MAIVCSIFIFIVVVLILVCWRLRQYNGLVKLRNRVEGAWAQIDVQLKRRYDLIPNLVETVKGYAAHERETLEARDRRPQRGHAADGPAGSRPQTDNILTGALRRCSQSPRRIPTSRPTTTSCSCKRS